MNKQASTLIEVMLAMVIIAIIAIGGGAFLYYGSRSVAEQRNKRVALETANTRLEEMRASDYNDIKPVPADNWDSHYLKKTAGGWLCDTANDETADINGLSLPITTTVQFVDGQGDLPPDSYDYILAVVQVGYRLSSAERVRLETYIAPEIHRLAQILKRRLYITDYTDPPEAD